MPVGSADAQHAHYWRMLEAEARILASAMTDLEPKRVMLLIAEAYKRLATRAELREPQPLIDNASFGPEALKVIGEAFDEAWTEIADNYSNVPVEREAAHVKLATALLSAAPRMIRTGSVGFRSRSQYALAFSECGREEFSNSWTESLSWIANTHGQTVRHGQTVQLCCLLQTNEKITAHPESGELHLEFRQKRSPPGARLSAGLESRRDVELAKF
jgi:hypothetical protein